MDKEKIGIAAAAVTAMGSGIAVSWLTTKYLMRIAMDRETPRTPKTISRMITRGTEDNAFLQYLKSTAEELKARENTLVELMSNDGELLSAHWIPCTGAERILIAMHGWRSTWYRDFGMISSFAEQEKCSVLYAEQRSMNRSSGDYIGFGLLERFDCLAWAEWVSEHNPDHLPVYLCGVSMGASTVLMAADLDLPEDIHGIIADCGFTSPSAVWKHIATDNLHLPTGINSRMAELVFRRNLDMDWDAWTTVDALKHTSLPVLFIHGTDDHFVPVTMTYENCKACAGPHRLLVVPGADHGMSYFIAKEEYEQALKNFWQEYD